MFVLAWYFGPACARRLSGWLLFVPESCEGRSSQQTHNNAAYTGLHPNVAPPSPPPLTPWCGLCIRARVRPPEGNTLKEEEKESYIIIDEG